MRHTIILSLVLLCCSLASCGIIHPYQPNIQQGNILTADTVSQLKLGMSQDQVASILGQPVLNSGFSDNHWAYVYTFQHSGGKVHKKRLDLFFVNGKLVKVDNLYPYELPSHK